MPLSGGSFSVIFMECSIWSQGLRNSSKHITFWPNLDQDICLWLRKYRNCQASKFSFQQFEISSQLYKTVCTDIFIPLPAFILTRNLLLYIATHRSVLIIIRNGWNLFPYPAFLQKCFFFVCILTVHLQILDVTFYCPRLRYPI